jgi:hypothetical protein
MFKPPEDVVKTTPEEWAVYKPGSKHKPENLQGIIIRDSYGYYRPYARFRGKEYRRGLEFSLRAASRSIRKALDGLDT